MEEGSDRVFCEEDDEKEKQSSFLSLFMKVDRHFVTKCFGQMQELGIYPGQIPVLGLVAKKDGLSQRELAAYQAAYGKCIDTETGESRFSL